MADFILVEGDKANYSPQFGAALVTVQFGKLKATGPGKINNKQICVEGDESSASVKNCTYLTLQFSIPGTGTLEIDQLDKSQVASKTNTGKTVVMLKGNYFKAKFKVVSPAKQQNPDGSQVSDTTQEYKGGRGYFLSTNVKVKGA